MKKIEKLMDESLEGAGFHDAILKKIVKDYEKSECTLEIDLYWERNEEAGEDIFKPVKLKLKGFYFYFTEKPDPTSIFDTHSQLNGGLQIDEITEHQPKDFLNSPDVYSIVSHLPEASVLGRFFIFNLNTFAYFASEDVELEIVKNSSGDQYGS